MLIAAFLAVTGISCIHTGGKNIDQGEIHYSISYSGDVGFMPKEIMPRNLIVSFKDNKILFNISAPFGNSGILNLSNPETGIFDTYINLLGFKYYYSAPAGENYPGFEAMEGIEIHRIPGTATICGFNCKSAEITFPHDRTKVYRVWYTDEIKVKNPNAATPFSEIHGVLMKFFFVMNDTELHFEAETVYKKDIPDKLFERKDKYHKISRKDIDNIINKFVSM
ncbi:MAG TPA: hypothetical protein DDW27_13015 [Bacteroidales bacterium]|nr:hypothetical protein [Bacteroidales bacterium]